ncbi:hypothetical protein GOBAR_AA30765 [Gossypium barbadense]|uniref:RNase H type-1 domain-containing protein n=1 Tax=Gossypium barbadense TaxID=3634 RepID=A0A2P5WFS3_GOSBA|nr:hypothetical protein GOBAR_AA30765 [Gossypium barbadense]
MQHRKLSNDTRYPRCGEAVETMNHIFRECPVTQGIWEVLSFAEFLKITHLEFKEWLTRVFEQISSLQCRIFCCALRAIWGDRNKRIHEKTSRSGKEIADYVNRYISELDGAKNNIPSSFQVVKRWEHPPSPFVKINFDAAYDGTTCQSAVGIVARDNEGKVLLSFSEIYRQVVSAYTAEAIACREAARIGIDMQWPQIIIEGDALGVIKKCKGRDRDRSMNGA